MKEKGTGKDDCFILKKACFCGQEQHRFWGKDDPGHAASASHHHAAAASAAGVQSGGGGKEKRKSVLVILIVSFCFFGMVMFECAGKRPGHSEVCGGWAWAFLKVGGVRCSRRGAVSESKTTKMANNCCKL